MDTVGVLVVRWGSCVVGIDDRTMAMVLFDGMIKGSLASLIRVFDVLYDSWV